MEAWSPFSIVNFIYSKPLTKGQLKSVFAERSIFLSVIGYQRFSNIFIGNYWIFRKISLSINKLENITKYLSTTSTVDFFNN